MPGQVGKTDKVGQGSFLRRLGWFVVLWLAGVGCVGTVAFVLRLWIA